MPRRSDRGDKTVNTLMVFFKVPCQGQVKTRLARDIGDRQALYVCKALLDYTLSNVAKVRKAEVVLLFDAPGGLEPEGLVPRNGWRLARQSGGDIGDRFTNAFKTVLKEHPGKAAIIGTDCIGLGPSLMKEAFARLDEVDVVIGPSEDGGYYLIGMKDEQWAKGLFKDIPWSTDKVFGATIERAWSMGLKVHVLPRLFDVDTEKEWTRAKREEPKIERFFRQARECGGGSQDD